MPTPPARSLGGSSRFNSGTRYPAGGTRRGRPVPVAQAVEAAADILAQARSPLIYGLSPSSTPGRSSAVRLADFLRANIDTTASTCHAPSILAVQASGDQRPQHSGEIGTSKMVVYWGSD